MSNQPLYETGGFIVGLDKTEVVNLLSRNLATERHFDSKYDWFYQACPWSDPEIIALRSLAEGKVVGMVTIGRRLACFGDRDVMVGIAADFVVDEAHRTAYPALLLLRAMKKRADEQFWFTYGFPNEKAVAAFRRVGFIQVATMKRYAAVVRYEYYLRTRLQGVLATVVGCLLDKSIGLTRYWQVKRSGLSAEWSDIATDEFTQFWKNTSAIRRQLLVTSRDKKFLRWRSEGFDQGVRYLILKREGNMVAWFACQDDNNVVFVRDFWIGSMDSKIIGRCFSAALFFGGREYPTHRAVSLEYAGNLAVASGLKASGFMERGSRQVFGLGREMSSLTSDNLFITGADEDEY